MNRKWIVSGISLLLAGATIGPSHAAAQTGTDARDVDGPLVLDSFADDAPSAYGRWSFSTDRVMGGLSNGDVRIDDVDGRRAMRITGDVRLENNGGFIQNSLRMNGTMDASSYDGVFVSGRALQPGAYYVFLRTRSSFMPWSYYSAPLEVGEEWSTIDLPWSAFKRNFVLRSLDPSQIRSVSVVAYGEAMAADIAVDRIGLYKCLL